MYISSRSWTVVEARRSFADLLRAARKHPQLITNRNRPVAVVVAPEQYEQFVESRSSQRSRSVAEAFDDLRSICREESYELSIPERENRSARLADED